MDNIYSEFEVRDDMNHTVFEYYKDCAINDVIQKYINNVKNSSDGEPSIFNKKIAFEITEKRYGIGDDMFERIILTPIGIQIIQEPVLGYIPKPKKYSFKDRIKILFTGKDGSNE